MATADPRRLDDAVDTEEPGRILKLARQRFEAYLHDNDLRLTRERVAILDEFYRIQEHIEADELLFRLRDADVRVSRSTVYRTLDLLVQAGLARKVSLGKEHAYFERILGRKRHEHMICLGCDRVVEWSDPELRHLVARNCQQHDFFVTRTSVQVFGYCADCARTDEGQRKMEESCVKLLERW